MNPRLTNQEIVRQARYESNVEWAIEELAKANTKIAFLQRDLDDTREALAQLGGTLLVDKYIGLRDSRFAQEQFQHWADALPLMKQCVENRIEGRVMSRAARDDLNNIIGPPLTANMVYTAQEVALVTHGIYRRLDDRCNHKYELTMDVVWEAVEKHFNNHGAFSSTRVEMPIEYMSWARLHERLFWALVPTEEGRDMKLVYSQLKPESVRTFSEYINAMVWICSPGIRAHVNFRDFFEKIKPMVDDDIMEYVQHVFLNNDPYKNIQPYLKELDDTWYKNYLKLNSHNDGSQAQKRTAEDLHRDVKRAKVEIPDIEKFKPWATRTPEEQTEHAKFIHKKIGKYGITKKKNQEQTGAGLVSGLCGLISFVGRL